MTGISSTGAFLSSGVPSSSSMLPALLAISSLPSLSIVSSRGVSGRGGVVANGAGSVGWVLGCVASSS